MKYKNFLLGAVLVGLFMFVGTVSANLPQKIDISDGSVQGVSKNLNDISGANGANISGTNSIPQIIANVVKFVLAISGMILLVLVIYAGIMWMTSSGNPEKIGKAKKLLTSSAVGLAIILGAYSISAFVVVNISKIISPTP